MQSFYWHDYETFGIHPALDYPSQFAGVRTDSQLNIIEEPLIIYNQGGVDALPNPEACILTGITPQYVQQHGLPEHEFIQKILDKFQKPGTCVVGYNNLSFDDEVTRFALFRNFHDPYAREWQHGNSRWDLLQVVRFIYALRPVGIQWPEKESGGVSFRLEHLAQANHLLHEKAHDAYFDILATIALAKKIMNVQPKLFAYALTLRQKIKVKSLLDLTDSPLRLYMTSIIPATEFCCAPIVPLIAHPENKNAIICYNAKESPDDLIQLDLDACIERLFMTKTQAQRESKQRLPLMTVYMNRSPMVVTPKVLSVEDIQRFKWSVDDIKANRMKLLSTPNIKEKISQIYQSTMAEAANEVVASLYSGGFLSDHDRKLSQLIVKSDPQHLSQLAPHFEDARLLELFTLYKARRDPSCLNSDEQQFWYQYCLKSWSGQMQGRLGLAEFQQKLRSYSTAGQQQHLGILEELEAYGRKIADKQGQFQKLVPNKRVLSEC